MDIRISIVNVKAIYNVVLLVSSWEASMYIVIMFLFDGEKIEILASDPREILSRLTRSYQGEYAEVLCRVAA